MKEEEEMGDAGVFIISKQIVQISPKTNGGGVERIHLSPWDLKMLPVEYVQKGILFHKPTNFPISNLFTSFSQSLHHFSPLAGRLVTTTHDDGSISISLDCTGEGAKFIHASAPHVTVSEIQNSYFVPVVVSSFFPLNRILNYDGQPLLGVQVTELADGIFIACSLNHSAADGTTFWQFIKTWSTICRTGNNLIENPPVFDRWFPGSCPVPIHLPFKDQREFIGRVDLPVVRECAFSFSPENIKKLKARANKEMGCDGKISSFQALLAHVWRSVSLARALKPDQETSCLLQIGCRSRLSPPLPETYVGNSIQGVMVKAFAGEVESNGLGWVSLRLNQAIAEGSDGAGIYRWLESWSKSPSFMSMDQFISSTSSLYISSSPRFDVYGNDFGWGKPVAVRSGPGNKVDGKFTVYPTAEEGGIAVEICSTAEVLSSLLQDMEFMEVVA